MHQRDEGVFACTLAHVHVCTVACVRDFCMPACVRAEMIRLLLFSVSHAIVLGILCVFHEIAKACSQQKTREKNDDGHWYLSDAGISA